MKAVGELLISYHEALQAVQGSPAGHDLLQEKLFEIHYGRPSQPGDSPEDLLKFSRHLEFLIRESKRLFPFLKSFKSRTELPQPTQTQSQPLPQPTQSPSPQLNQLHHIPTDMDQSSSDSPHSPIPSLSPSPISGSPSGVPMHPPSPPEDTPQSSKGILPVPWSQVLRFPSKFLLRPLKGKMEKSGPYEIHLIDWAFLVLARENKPLAISHLGRLCEEEKVCQVSLKLTELIQREVDVYGLTSRFRRVKDTVHLSEFAKEEMKKLAQDMREDEPSPPSPKPQNEIPAPVIPGLPFPQVMPMQPMYMFIPLPGIPTSPQQPPNNEKPNI